MVLTGWEVGLGSLALCAWQGLCSAFGFVTEGEERSDEPEVEEPKWGRPYSCTVFWLHFIYAAFFVRLVAGAGFAR